MSSKQSKQKREHPSVKSKLHPRNKHRQRYDLNKLASTLPELKPYIQPNAYGDESIDFFDPMAVKLLNKALMQHHYGIQHWDIPNNYLSPPIPSRVDYLHYIADLLAHYNKKRIPRGQQVRCLDIGTGASCVYPILAHSEFGWSSIGSDIDPIALGSAGKIIRQNEVISGKIELRLQPNKKDILTGIMKQGEKIDVVVCNPPFHASEAEAQAATRRKLQNLKRQKIAKAILNFGGISTELWCEGGEKKIHPDHDHPKQTL